MKVQVTFTYDPEEPDEQDPTGMSEDEYIKLSEEIAQAGGYDIGIDKLEVSEK